MLFDVFLIVFLTIVFFATVILNFRENGKEKAKFLANKQCIKEIECRIVDFADNMYVKLTFSYSPVFEMLIFEDSIAFVTGHVIGGSYQPEIEIKDINFVRMENIYQTDLLLINHNAKYKDENKSKTKYPSQFYLRAKEEDLLFIKNFIEERIDRPKVIDLTGGNQTER